MLEPIGTRITLLLGAIVSLILALWIDSKYLEPVWFNPSGRPPGAFVTPVCVVWQLAQCFVLLFAGPKSALVAVAWSCAAVTVLLGPNALSLAVFDGWYGPRDPRATALTLGVGLQLSMLVVALWGWYSVRRAAVRHGA